MKIWLVRHGQTNLNKYKLMQGITDEPLNDTGRSQGERARKFVEDIEFDAVYASPLIRAIETASIVSGLPMSDVIIDKRITEVDFGKYELCKYSKLGIRMSLYWALPEVFSAPDGVEDLKSMISRSQSFLKDIENKNYKNVLIASHGGILRAMNGYLLDRRNGLRWRPKMHNCEIRVYSSSDGTHSFIKTLK